MIANRPEKLWVRGRLLGTGFVSDLRLEGGRVVGVRRAGKAAPDLGSAASIIAPTLFDIQVNGAGGFNLQGNSVTVQGVLAISQILAQHGVSRWIPTLVTGSIEEMEHGCGVLAEAMEHRLLKRAIPGIHLEGPYISPEDGPRGAHPRAHVRTPNLREIARFRKAARNRILYITMAPEQPKAITCIRALTRDGVLVSLGHHAANAAQIAAAAEAGARLSTHLGNGSSPMMHRQHNPLWPQLAEDRLHASFIADLHHVPAPALKTFARAKQPKRTILISDCVDLTGLEPGKYTFSGAKVELLPSGKICLLGTDLLAGSGLHLIHGVVNAWRAGALTLEEAFASASSVPAKLFGLAPPPSPAEVGRKADFMVLHAEAGDERPRIEAVFIAGKRF